MPQQKDPPNPPGPSETPAPAPRDLAPEDYYFDGRYIVFTEAYHRKRGYCCNSGCRHCPWRDAQATLKNDATP